MTGLFTQLPHHLYKLLKGHGCRCCLHITGVALGQCFLLALSAPLLDAFCIMNDALLNGSTLKKDEGLWTTGGFLPSCSGEIHVAASRAFGCAELMDGQWIHVIFT